MSTTVQDTPTRRTSLADSADVEVVNEKHEKGQYVVKNEDFDVYGEDDESSDSTFVSAVQVFYSLTPSRQSSIGRWSGGKPLRSCLLRQCRSGYVAVSRERLRIADTPHRSFQYLPSSPAWAW